MGLVGQDRRDVEILITPMPFHCHQQNGSHDNGPSLLAPLSSIYSGDDAMETQATTLNLASHVLFSAIIHF